MGEQVAALSGIGQAAAGIAQATEGAGRLVAAVRVVVRDLIAECVAVLAARLPQWLAVTGVTVGIASPWVISQVSSLVAEWVVRINRFLSGLVTSLGNLSPLLARLGDLLAQQRLALEGLARRDPTIARMTSTGTGGPPPPPRRDPDDDPAQVKEDREAQPIAGVTRLRADEEATGARLAEMFPERAFRESRHRGANYVDDLGRSYDAVGGGTRASEHLNVEEFLKSIRRHL